jgi:outer membrane protein OmpA-like peptidoglycan-associated protein
MAQWKAIAGSLVVLALWSDPAAARPDPRWLKELDINAPGSSDHVVPRYAGSTILVQTRKDFDELPLPMGPAVGKGYARNDPANKLRYERVQGVEGRVTRTVYVVPEGRSTLEVVRNYSDAMQQKGARTLYTCNRIDCGREFHKVHYGDGRHLETDAPGYTPQRRDLAEWVFDDIDPAADQRLWVGQWTAPEGNDVYLVVYAATQTGGRRGNVTDSLKGRAYALVEVLETKAMQQNLEFVSAQQMAGAINKDGRVALYGIFFDFDKADLKPESDRQLAEMASLLKAEPGLRAFVVGHTDNKGSVAYNVDLSRRRADSVVRALTTRYGIAADRLMPHGVGPVVPLAPNDSEEGRARNRRVELAKN